jgi:hypothetical protein
MKAQEYISANTTRYKRVQKERRNIDCKIIPLPALPLERHVIEFVRELVNNSRVVFKYQQGLQ